MKKIIVIILSVILGLVMTSCSYVRSLPRELLQERINNIETNNKNNASIIYAYIDIENEGTIEKYSYSVEHNSVFTPEAFSYNTKIEKSIGSVSSDDYINYAYCYKTFEDDKTPNVLEYTKQKEVTKNVLSLPYQDFLDKYRESAFLTYNIPYKSITNYSSSETGFLISEVKCVIDIEESYVYSFTSSFVSFSISNVRFEYYYDYADSTYSQIIITGITDDNSSVRYTSRIYI